MYTKDQFKLRIRNDRSYAMDLFWISYSGKLVNEATINVNRSIEIHAFYAERWLLINGENEDIKEIVIGEGQFEVSDVLKEISNIRSSCWSFTLYENLHKHFN